MTTAITTRIEQLEDESRREGVAVLVLDEGHLVVRYDTELRPGKLRYDWRLIVEDFAYGAEVRTEALPSGGHVTYNTGATATPDLGLMGCPLSRDDAEALLRGETPAALTNARARYETDYVRMRELIAENRAAWEARARAEAVTREMDRVVEDVPLRAKRKLPGWFS